MKSIHPFPARMAPEIALKELPKDSSRLRVLDPMAGSGTTLVTARLQGHKAIGFDSDPLAVLISATWSANVDLGRTESKAAEILTRAKKMAKKLKKGGAYPAKADKETKDFIRFWFDDQNRVQLTALSKTISRIHDRSLRNLMWCAVSRMIITKKSGVSLAMDVSHSRPHRKYEVAPIRAFDHFLKSVKQMTNSSPFLGSLKNKPRATIKKGDARKLPLEANSVDMVITSPPYLNAIDYIRGHKLSLVWMGHSIGALRKLRASNIGTESSKSMPDDPTVAPIMKRMCTGKDLSSRDSGILKQYVHDTKSILHEIHRVLRPQGKAVLVIGNCNIRKTFIKNSLGIKIVARQVGLTVHKTRRRPLPENRRYLPPPGTFGAGRSLHKRMREEVILTLLKPK